MDGVIRNNQILMVDSYIVDKIFSIRNEIFEAIHNAQIHNAFDKDVILSFGSIHINPSGSISQISFSGVDVTDMDKFIAQRALNVKEENYHDIRKFVKDNTMCFSFYPISDGRRITYTILKRSPFFIKEFGDLIDDPNKFRIKYSPKYVLVSIFENNEWENHVYVIDLFSKEQICKLLINDAIRKVGHNGTLYYCFANTRPEILEAIGQCQKDFMSYKKPAEDNYFNFYRGPIINLILRIYKDLDEDNEPRVKKTRRILAQFIIDGVYGGNKKFCDSHSITEKSLRKYLSGESNNIEYENGNKINGGRLEEILNIQTQITAISLKNSNLLTKVSFSDIPEDGYEFFQ